MEDLIKKIESCENQRWLPDNTRVATTGKVARVTVVRNISETIAEHGEKVVGKQVYLSGQSYVLSEDDLEKVHKLIDKLSGATVTEIKKFD